jgi:hypothetical protein
MARINRKFTAEEMAEIKRLRSVNIKFGEIANRFKTNVQCVKNAFYYSRVSQNVSTQDRMPAALKAWPAGVDFRPDELKLELSKKVS